jgi:hypothetical protein
VKTKPFASAVLATLLLLSLATATAAPSAFGATWVKAKGAKGQVLSATANKNLIDGQTVTVKGSGYSKKVGIYVTYCVIPPKGERPDLCGPFDITGQNNASTWVSSNPPLYAAALVKPFGKGGTFRVQLKLTKMIGDQDCSVVRCAITTRADHTRSADRSADAFIPVTFAAN